MPTLVTLPQKLDSGKSSVFILCCVQLWYVGNMNEIAPLPVDFHAILNLSAQPEVGITALKELCKSLILDAQRRCSSLVLSP